MFLSHASRTYYILFGALLKQPFGLKWCQGFDLGLRLGSGVRVFGSGNASTFPPTFRVTLSFSKNKGHTKSVTTNFWGVGVPLNSGVCPNPCPLISGGVPLNLRWPAKKQQQRLFRIDKISGHASKTIKMRPEVLQQISGHG